MLDRKQFLQFKDVEHQVNVLPTERSWEDVFIDHDESIYEQSGRESQIRTDVGKVWFIYNYGFYHTLCVQISAYQYHHPSAAKQATTNVFRTSAIVTICS